MNFDYFVLVDISLKNSKINDNKCNNDGTIYVGSGNINLTNVDWERNTVNSGSGSAIYIDRDVNGNSLTVSRNTFIDNIAQVDGTLSMFNGNATITDSNFDANRANSGSGAGLFIENNGVIKMTSCNFSNHYSHENGTVHLSSGSMSMDNLRFINNRAKNGYGSSIYFLTGLFCVCFFFFR